MTTPIFTSVLRGLLEQFNGTLTATRGTASIPHTPPDDDLVFKVGIVGPTQVGKTSLIASMLRDAERVLHDTSLTLEAYDPVTRKAVSNHRRAIEGSLVAGEFEPGAVQPTLKVTNFQLRLAAKDATAGVRLSLLDYPGGWLDPDIVVQLNADDQRDAVRGLEFLEQSSVLLIPVDATVLMEAQTSPQKRSLPALLATPEVRDVAQRWAKNRTASREEPALAIFCPVKCESYLADNGGLRDASAQLFAATQRVYRDTWETIREIAPHASVLYCPVDTLGCVRLIRTQWKFHPSLDNTLECMPTFAVRPPARVRSKGTEGILLMICRQLATARQRAAELVREKAGDEAAIAREYADRREGLFRNTLLQVTGLRRLRREAAEEREEQAALELHRVEELNRIVGSLAERPLGDRAHHW